jgi:hypothetical protein
MRTTRLLLCLLILIGAACSGDEEPTVQPQDSPAPPPSTPAEGSPSPVPTEEDFDCVNQADAVAGTASSDRSLTGDVDGDGNNDTVTVVIDASGSDGCQAFIIVESAAGTSSTPIEQEGMSLDVGFPALVSLVNIDGEPGLDIVMNMIAGASTQFAGVYTAGAGQPERLTFDQPTEFGNLFPTGGSVGHMEATDCVGPGAIIISVATPKGDEYKVTRTAYVVVEGKLTPQEEGASTERIPATGFDRFPEFQASPFGSCPTA